MVTTSFLCEEEIPQDGQGIPQSYLGSSENTLLKSTLPEFDEDDRNWLDRSRRRGPLANSDIRYYIYFRSSAARLTKCHDIMKNCYSTDVIYILDSNQFFGKILSGSEERIQISELRNRMKIKIKRNMSENDKMTAAIYNSKIDSILKIMKYIFGHLSSTFTLESPPEARSKTISIHMVYPAILFYKYACETAGIDGFNDGMYPHMCSDEIANMWLDIFHHSSVYDLFSLGQWVTGTVWVKRMGMQKRRNKIRYFTSALDFDVFSFFSDDGDRVLSASEDVISKLVCEGDEDDINDPERANRAVMCKAILSSDPNADLFPEEWCGMIGEGGVEMWKDINEKMSTIQNHSFGPQRR